MMRGVLVAAAVALVAILAGAHATMASGQIVDNPGFKALPRAIHYDTPLVPKQGPKAVIVYGKNAPYTKTAAQAVQKAIQEWCGAGLEMVDDHAVTSDQTWLLNEAYLKTPLVVLGNAQDNRAMHALGTRCLLASNHTWPGGDRFVIRSICEPFAADVNYVVLEASTPEGLNAAAAKLAAMLTALPKDPAATLPLLREVGCVKDAWAEGNNSWAPPEEYRGPAGRSIGQIAMAAAKSPQKFNSFEAIGSLCWLLQPYVCGGGFGTGQASRCALTPDQIRQAAAMLLNICRADGGRITQIDYGQEAEIMDVRCLVQTGLLDEKELDELESILAVSGAIPTTTCTTTSA